MIKKEAKSVKNAKSLRDLPSILLNKEEPKKVEKKSKEVTIEKPKTETIKEVTKVFAENKKEQDLGSKVSPAQSFDSVSFSDVVDVRANRSSLVAGSEDNLQQGSGTLERDLSFVSAPVKEEMTDMQKQQEKEKLYSEAKMVYSSVEEGQRRNLNSNREVMRSERVINPDVNSFAMQAGGTNLRRAGMIMTDSQGIEEEDNGIYKVERVDTRPRMPGEERADRLRKYK